MTQRSVTARDAGDKALRELYQTSFPVEEQIPWDDLIRLVDEMPLYFTAYYDGERLVGLTIVFPNEPFTWFWYFAVQPELRGQGIGQRILSAFIDRYRGRRCVLDMESPRQPCDNAEQRRRRHAFYQRNGFRDTNVFRTFDGIEYTIMMLGDGTFTIQDYNNILAALRRHWWRDDALQ